MIATSDSAIQFATHPPLPDDFEVYKGHLLYKGIDLLSLIQHPMLYQGRIEMPDTPIYVRHLPSLRHNYQALNNWFRMAKTRTGFPGDLMVAYASKANPSEPVVRTLLQEGAAYECSSSFDVDVARHAAASGWLDKTRPVLANGFKINAYARNLIQFRRDGFENVLPIFGEQDEIAVFAESGLTFEVGLRSRTSAQGLNRFGLTPDEMEQAAGEIMASENLVLTTFHAMQTVQANRGLMYQQAMVQSLRNYAHLRRLVPTLHRYNLGGGLPGRNTGHMDFQDWMIQVLQNVMAVCYEEEVPVPDLIIESGRFLVEDHACKMFRVVKTKMADDDIPFYMIDGSIMSNFPDAWALGEKFTVLPINHWDSAFSEARLSGLTCDPDDIYPTRKMGETPLDLPIDSNGLVIGFFDCGAYQETLGGRHGSKHCLLPEGPELIADDDGYGSLAFSYQAAQTSGEVLSNLGYCRAKSPVDL